MPNDGFLRIPSIGSAPGGNSFTVLLFGRLYGRRIQLYRGIYSDAPFRHSQSNFDVGQGWRPTQVKIRVCLRRRSCKRRLSEGHIVSQLRHSRPPRQLPADVAPAQPTGRILQCLVPDEPPRGQPREVLLSISSSDLTSVPQSRRRARASGGGDQTKKLPRNSESSPIDITAVQETRSTASHRSSAGPTGEMTGVTLSRVDGGVKPKCSRAPAVER